MSSPVFNPKTAETDEMRLQRFDLTRYGKFTDKIIDFGTARQGKPDFHIIYGPNEAGKSTLFSGFLDLIFGIASQTPYNFLHPYNTMQIGGLVEVNGETKEFLRLKRANNSLFDGQNRPLPETAIRADIGTIERDSYRTMFSLDDETLEQGGENILASKGDLGELLFSASAGLAQLSNKLTDLRSEADQFYKFRARNGELLALKAQLSALKAEREQLDVFAADYALMAKNRDQAHAQYEAVQAERNQLRFDVLLREKQLNALPRLAAWKRHYLRFEPLQSLPIPPAEWSKEVVRLQNQEIELRVQLQALEEEISRLEIELSKIILDERAATFAARLDALEDLRARYVTASKDLPERRLELREIEGAQSVILRRLSKEGEKDVQSLLLSAQVTGQLTALIEAWSGIDIALKTATTEYAHAEQQIRLLNEQEPEVSTSHAFVDFDSPAIAELSSLYENSKLHDHQSLLLSAKERFFDCEENLETKLSALDPFDEGAAVLSKMQVPAVTQIVTWKTEVASAQKSLAAQHLEIARLQSHVARLQSEKDALVLSQGLTDHLQAAEIRQQREQAWALHRSQMNESSASHFETLLRQDDQVQTSRINQLVETTKLQQLSYDHKISTDELARVIATSKETEASLDRLYGAISAATQKMSPSLAQFITIDNLENWLSMRALALDSHTQYLVAERKLKALVETEQQTVADLKSALQRVGVAPERLGTEKMHSLLAEAQQLLDSKAVWQSFIQARKKSDEELQRRKDAFATVEKASAEWQNDWIAVCNQCWLGSTGEAATLGTVREILPLLRDLESLSEKQASLADRIDKMETDQTIFRDKVTHIAVDAGLDNFEQDPLELAYQLKNNCHDAAVAAERHRKLTDSLTDAEDKRSAIAIKQTLLDEHKLQKTRFFAVETLEAVAEKLRQVDERIELEHQLRDAEAELFTILGVASIDAAEAQLNNIVREDLDIELTKLRARSEDVEDYSRQLYLARNKADEEIASVGGDDAIAKIEERRRTLLLEVEEGARNYLQLRIGIAAAEQGLIAYRDKHRSSMMERASHAFRTISRGDYQGLTTQPGKDGEILIARGSDGSSKEAQELSKGTRFQLYLALRVAGYYEFVREKPALPFIADDIMESFDDFRAEETLRLFAQMAEVGQVIYLTHHQHLCDIAKEICPDVKLHNLQS